MNRQWFSLVKDGSTIGEGTPPPYITVCFVSGIEGRGMEVQRPSTLSPHLVFIFDYLFLFIY